MCPPLLAAIPAAVGAVGSAVSTVGAGTIASLAGTGLSAYGAIQQGNAQKAAADAQAQALNNQATTSMQQGEYQAARKQTQINQTIGTQLASVAGSGFNLDGSPSDVIASTASEGALDTRTTRYSSLIQANNLSYQAKLARQSGQSAQQAGLINAGSSVINGIGDFDKNGGFTRLWQGWKNGLGN